MRPPLLLAAALAVGAVAAGCGSGPLNSPAQGVGCSVTVEIPSTSSGPLGEVEIRYQGKSQLLTRNVNTIPLGCGLSSTLTARPSSPSSHPFTNWVVSGQVSHQATVTVTVDGLITARPSFYVPVVSVATPTPTAKPSASPSASPATVVLDKWMSYDSATKTANLTLEAGVLGINNQLNFDGHADGSLDVSVPLGWKVVVNFSNVGSINHSAAVVAPGGSSVVFPGASTPSPTTGEPPGSKDTFSFVASQVGSYRIACLLPGHEALGMWATFDVTSGGLPTIHT